MGTEPRKLKILITGSARGIGRGLFHHFLSLGHSVCILDLTPPNSHTRSTKQKPGKAPPAAVRLDVLINNAMAVPHIWSGGRKMEDEHADGEDSVMKEWDEKIAVGLTAPFILSRLCVPLLKGDGKGNPPGCIINISSTRAYQAEMDHEGYSAVEAGILGLTQSMAVSLGHRHKIRVNAIVPGWVDVEDQNKSADEMGTKWGEGQSKEDRDGKMVYPE
ncbi:hypothetical protein BCR34DRAFT_625457 [Clohesyomyces aquaticus]|uniref:NAD(P)-binding protein n=1 Tax=Clohesyomyces aquaticus TaxID=1231657 RepID=A0A1Y1ZIJ6_9PLEO|nr:hypothetical protein BCR34DRAFT_625457 [Clohesyomyces aquaticus]